MNKIFRRLSRNRTPLLFLVFIIVVLMLQFMWLTRVKSATSSRDAPPPQFDNNNKRNAAQQGPSHSNHFGDADASQGGGGPQHLLEAGEEHRLRTFADFALQQLDLVPFPNGNVDLVMEQLSEGARAQMQQPASALARLFPHLRPRDEVVVCLDASAGEGRVDRGALRRYISALGADYPLLGHVVLKAEVASDAQCDVLVFGDGVQLPAAVAAVNRARLDSDPQHQHALEREGYSVCFLPATGHIHIRTAAALGVLNAFRTLLNLAMSSNPFQLIVRSGCIVNDVPKLAWRGQHFDTARHFHDTATIFAILREMGKTKMNVFHWHLSDDQGWRVEMKSHPSLHKIGGRRGPPLNGKRFVKYQGLPYPEPKYHTQSEIRAVIEFAWNRGITVMPELDLPAHAAAMVAALATEGIHNFGVAIATDTANVDCAPIPANLAAFGAPNCMGGVFGMMLPTARAMAVVTEILDELLDLFSESPYFHLGGDEAEFIRDLTWKGVAPGDLLPEPDEAAAAAAVGGMTFGALQARVARALIAVVARRNRTAVVWDETLLELDPAWAPAAPTMPMLWRDDYMSIDDIVKKYVAVRGEDDVRRNLPRLILTPKTRLYFDYLQHVAIAENKFWPLQRPGGASKHKAVTLKRAFQAHAVAQSHPIVYGVEGCLWTELLFNKSMVMYQLFPRMYAVADVGWSARVAPGASVAVLDEDFAGFAEMARRIDSFRKGRQGD